MPELPEVEAARKAIEEHCTGKKVRRSVVANDSKVIEGVSPSELESALVGKTIIAALRKGKNLWLRLDSPPFPSFQFGMSGAVYIKGVAVTKYKRSAVSDEDEWPSKFSKVFMELEDGLELSFTDKRRFARVRLLQDPEAVPPISELGPDALLEPLQIEELVNALRKRNTAIKALLLNQSFVSGIGNWIADEVLYQARIHPLQIASRLSREDCESLHRCIEEVIRYAVEVDADCNSFPIEWLFHYRWGKKPGKVNAVEVGADSSQYPSNWIFHSREKKSGEAFVDGKRIEFIAAGGRTTAFVPELQKLIGVKSVKGKSNQSRKANPDEEEDDEGSKGEEIEKEKEIKRQPKKGKNKKVGSHRQQKVDASGDNSEEANEKEKPKKKNGKKPLAADKTQPKVVKANRNELKSLDIRAKAQAKESSKKRSGSNEASTQQKKKIRK
ncbi:formamidopyrimidine-DNA glycosylase isoform X6 [Dendrobium catenatum]|uniref:formamidopyrimidine-DNA glycosylase isoform X6 n=1 Tax=Dendrobium catenatum TaxID=906689 RepID=UPI0009F6ED63|nr:formamidopyrimidine-DNA glycosylase isoform X6 [Dendrobium catenatum]